MTTAIMHPVKKLLLPLLLLALSGCDLGEGSKLETLEIVSASGATITPPYRVYQCFRDRLQVFGRFTNGDVGNFSANGRAIWSSSNPNIVRVLNDSEQNTRAVILGKFDNIGGSFYTAGVLVPRNAGSATVTASFLGLSASMDVVVSAPGLTIAPVPIGSASAGAATGVGFANQFTVRATLDKGQVIDAVSLRRQDPGTLELLNPVLWQFTDNNYSTSFVAGNSSSTFSLDREDLNLFPTTSTRTTSDPAVTGTESATLRPAFGELRAIRTNNPNPTIQVVFDTDPDLGVSCPVAPAALLTPIGALVAPKLVVSHEPGYNGDLVVATDENLVTTAQLDTDGDSVKDSAQDVSTQVGYEVIQSDRDGCVGTTDCTLATNRSSSIFTFSGGFNPLTTVPGTNGSFCSSSTVANASGDPRFDGCDTVVDTVNVHACTPTCATATTLSNDLPFRAIPATLTSYDAIAGTTTQQAFTFPGRQFSVMANFTASTANNFVGGPMAQQNVSRYMGWIARPAGSTTEVSEFVSLFGLYGTVGGQTYYLRNPTAPTTLDIIAIPATSTRIGSFANATTTTPAPAMLTITPAQ